MSEKVQFVRNSILSYSGKIITILSSLIYTFLIANSLGPKDYGLVNYYLSFTLGLVGLVGVYFFGGLINVFMPKCKSRKLFQNIFIIVLVLSVTIFFVILLFSDSISIFLKKGNPELLQIASILLLIMPFVVIYTALFRSFKMFGEMLKFDTIVAGLNLFMAFFLIIILNYGVMGVLYASIFSNFIGTAFLFLRARGLEYLNNSIDSKTIKTYSRYGIMSTFLHRIDGLVQLIFIGIFVANEDLGLYYIAFKIASIVLSVPVNSLTEVLLPYVSEYSEDKSKISKYMSLNIKFSLILVIILSLLIVIFSKFFLIFLFPKYVDAYQFLVLISPLFIVLSLGLLTNLYLSLNRMDVIAVSYLGEILSTIIFGLLLMPSFGVYGLILTLILNAVVGKSILVYYLGYVGLSVEIIPRKQDFMYFLDSFRNIVWWKN